MTLIPKVENQQPKILVIGLRKKEKDYGMVQNIGHMRKKKWLPEVLIVLNHYTIQVVSWVIRKTKKQVNTNIVKMNTTNKSMHLNI